MLALALLLCGQTIEMPATIAGVPGQFIPVRPIKTDGKIVQYYPIDDGLSVFPASLLSDTTATVVTSVRPGKYRLLAYTALADKPSTPVVVTIVIGDGGPTPPPTPVPPTPVPPTPVPPTPVPVPKIDDATYGLGTFIFNQVKNTVPNSAERSAVAKAFSDNFKGIAAQIGAGTLTDIVDALRQTTAKNDEYLANVGSRSEWEKSANALQQELLRLNRDRKLVKPEEFRVAFLELSSGFAALAALK